MKSAAELLDYNLDTESVIVSRDVKFIQDEFPARLTKQQIQVQKHSSASTEEPITVQNPATDSTIS